MTNLPATFNEAEARAWAHKALTLFKEKPAEIFGEYIHPFDAAECRLLTVDLLKDFALIDTEHMMQLVSWAREGIGLAQDAAQQLINEFDNRGIETPTILKAYGMDLIRNSGATSETNIWAEEGGQRSTRQGNCLCCCNGCA